MPVSYTHLDVYKRQCEYCLPCPSGVAIPRNFEVYNEAAIYDAWKHGRWAYENTIDEDARADQCVECGQCETVCPQNIEIIDWLARVHETLCLLYTSIRRHQRMIILNNSNPMLGFLEKLD